MKTQDISTALQSVRCVKDKNLYVYKVDENPYFIEEEYMLVNCFPLLSNGQADFSKEVGIYGKDLVNADASEKI